MKKQILISLISLSSILSLKAQIYTPNGVIQGLSGNNNVGIGATNPLSKLEVRGGNLLIRNFDNTDNSSAIMIAHSINIGDYTTFGTSIRTITQNASSNVYGLQFFTQESYATGQTEKIRILGNGNVGIGTNSPISLLTLRNSSLEDNAGSGSIDLTFATTSGGLGTKISTFKETFNCAGMAFFTQYGYRTPIERMRITSTGYVGIGTVSPAYQLDVCGTIRAKEVVVNLLGGCDFVFKSDYKLMDLKKLEEFVKTNQHLPEVASEKEMVENGVNMKELQMKLLQKMEEMTLYMIEQNKKIETLENEIKEMKTK